MSRVAQGDGPRGEHPGPHSEECQPPIQRRLEIVAGFTSESVAAFRQNGWPTWLGIRRTMGLTLVAGAEKDRITVGEAECWQRQHLFRR